jgi:hypothetical protein
MFAKATAPRVTGLYDRGQDDRGQDVVHPKSETRERRMKMERKPITPRLLNEHEQSWVQEILQGHPDWADVDLSTTRVTAECDCGNCNAAYLEADSPQNPRLKGTKGYIGRIEIRTAEAFGITVTLDQHDGNLDQLYVDFLDLEEKGDRRRPSQWRELAHIYTKM